MARKWIERIGWDAFREGEWYTVAVEEVTKCAEPRGMLVKLLFRESPHTGRVQDVFLSLPGRPSSVTAEFVRSTGIETPDGTFTPRDAIGRTIKARFAPSPDGKNWIAAGFQPAAADTAPATNE